MSAPTGRRGGSVAPGPAPKAGHPPKDTQPEAEGTSACLYRLYYRCWDDCRWDIEPDHQCYEVLSCPITKTTAKRIYFLVRGRSYFVVRADFDTDGHVWHRPLHDQLYLTPPEIPGRPKPKSIPELRREMADAHPDRGGDRDTFMAARARYLAAKATA